MTKKETAHIPVENGEFVFSPDNDIVKVAVVERHQMTGNVACGFLKGYGIKEGAVALSIAHDSHNIIVTGVSDEEMAFAVEKLKEQNGGIVLVKNGEVIESMPMPIACLLYTSIIAGCINFPECQGKINKPVIQFFQNGGLITADNVEMHQWVLFLQGMGCLDQSCLLYTSCFENQRKQCFRR